MLSRSLRIVSKSFDVNSFSSPSVNVWLNLVDSLFFSAEGGRIIFHLGDVVNLPARSTD